MENQEMKVLFKPTTGMLDVPTHYCPGCTHGIIHRLVGEVLEELDIIDKTIGVAPVGCSVLAYDYFACDMFEAAHGRAPAVATGIKRANPDKIVFTYQGDGDLAAIGTAEAVHIAARGEKIVTIFVNNCIYGMTGGQMAPTTLPGQVTETSPYGRDVKTQGFPIRFSEMVAQLDGAHYVERVSVDKVAAVAKAKKAIKKAFENAIAGKGFNLVEVLSICPTNWGLSTEESLKWLRENMIPYYPLGVVKDMDAVKEVEAK
ncbi:2-oxoglutarate oxidoreductase [Youngiibacter fragilis 232.1]|uniref:2-oxoglutarate oxidoreductase n=2 Tax=Youngiibacter TaxID=1408818 RepID=V7I9T7_9CLOT|nr:2-oxoglutarate oxidoreductase [Youngiibacter fragilis 232.1]